jgi:hypothetical protein
MCAGHFAEILKENPLPDSNDPLALFRWSVHVHNLVNARLGKPIFRPEQAMEHWTTKKTHVLSETRTQFDFKILIIILLVIALVFTLFRK